MPGTRIPVIVAVFFLVVASVAPRPAAAAGFSPSAVRGNVLWLDASDASTLSAGSGAGVAAWKDKSPFGNSVAQNVVSQQPALQANALGGRPTLRFALAASQTLLTTAFKPVTMPALSVFVVHAEQSDTGNYGRLISFYDVNGYDYITGAHLGLSNVPHNAFDFRDVEGRFPVTGSNDGVDQRTGSTPLGTYVLEDEAISAGQVAAYFNGGREGSQISTGYGSISSNALRIASGFPGRPDNFSDESIAEIVAYNRVLTDTERQSVEGYLACKWGLQGALVAGHPYANACGAFAQGAILVAAGGVAAGGWSAAPGPSSGLTNTYAVSSAIDTSAVPQPAPQAVYQRQRDGSAFTYALAGLTPGAPYTVRLHFAETYWNQENQRTFDVNVNGTPALWNFDIFAVAGAKNRAVVRSFGTSASAAGTIVVSFRAQKNLALVAGIEVREAGLLPASPADNLTNHYDGYRTSWDPQEQALTATNVTANSFGLLKQLWVDASVDAQPLVATGEFVPSLGTRHDLLIVATEKDSVYAFDANTYQLIWQRSLLGSGERSLDQNDVGGCADLIPDIGITGTPVIDRPGDALYLDAQTYSSATASYHHRIHALSLSSGADLVTPAEVTGSAAGNQTFNPQYQRQRAGLTLANGIVYVGFASFCDEEVNPGNAPVVGWYFGFNATTLAPISSGDVAGASYLDSIWQGGVAPAADAQGNVYLTTGNGPYDGTSNFGMSLVKLAPNLSALDSFTTRNQAAETNADLDLSSGGVMLVPDQSGPYPHLAFQESKVPALRVFNRDNLGGYSGGPAKPEGVVTYAYLSSCDPTVSVACANPSNSQSQAGGLWGGIAYYAGPGGQQFIVAADNISNAHSFALATSPNVRLTLAAQSGVTLPNEGGATPIVTSNGTLPGSAIVWLLNRAEPVFELQAYDAATMRLIYAGAGGEWNSPSADSMLVPTVVNGRVYVPAQVLATSTTPSFGEVAVFGLRGAATPNARPSPARTAIRLAGPVVFGPGSRIAAARTSGRIVPPMPRAKLAAHAFFGVLRSNAAGRMVFALRGGGSIAIDARSALANGFVSGDIGVGKPCYVTVNPVRSQTAPVAVSVLHLRRSFVDLPPDR